jgi:hypothetical protein
VRAVVSHHTAGLGEIKMVDWYQIGILCLGILLGFLIGNKVRDWIE